MGREGEGWSSTLVIAIIHTHTLDLILPFTTHSLSLLSLPIPSLSLPLAYSSA